MADLHRKRGMKIFVDKHISVMTVRALAFMGHEGREMREIPEEGTRDYAV